MKTAVVAASWGFTLACAMFAQDVLIGSFVGSVIVTTGALLFGDTR